MNSAKDRITPKKVKAAKAADKPATVKVDAPHIEFNPQIVVDMHAFAEAVENAVDKLHALVENTLVANAKMVALMDKQRVAIEDFAKVKFDPPAIKMPDRPNDFSVEFNDENGDLTTMRIHANASH